MSDLEEFYQTWSDNPEHIVRYINEAAVRKIDAMLAGMPAVGEQAIATLIDFGCGYGKSLSYCAERLGAGKAYGFDFSEKAIEYAKHNFGSSSVQFAQLKTLDPEESARSIQSLIGGEKVDCVLLIDLLEHVPDCTRLIAELSKVAKFFLIKLPVEENVLNNYVLRKNYPSSVHNNGHLREFNANSVYYFVRALGLTPLAEGLYIYDERDSYPVTDTRRLGLLKRVAKRLLRLALRVFSVLLPRKIFIRLFGNGGYYCLATFKPEHVLRPY